MYKTIHLLRESEISLIRQQCEIKRNLISTILTLAMTSDKNIGYLLTGDKSKFAETHDGGATIWIYQCAEKMSYLLETDKCYKEMIISDYYVAKHVDPISRQTFAGYPDQEIDCESAKSRFFQLDHKDPKSWYTISPDAKKSDTPLTFSPEIMKRITRFNIYEAQQAGLYTPAKMSEFWDKIVIIPK
jgi:hypothetical protein